MKELKPPGSLANLQRRVSAFGIQRGFPPDRIHQRVSSEIFLKLLEQAKAAGIIQIYLLKGGMGMELRFGLAARASGDIDIGIQAPLNELVRILDRILRLTFDDFTFERRGNAELLPNVRTLRISIAILYRGSVYGRLNIDLSEADYEPPTEEVATDVLAALGLHGAGTIPLLRSNTQIAHKLHGATEPSTATYSNRRYRDLLDVLIFDRESSRIDFTALRYTVIDEFKRRRGHQWPPLFQMPQNWKELIVEEAREANFKDPTWEALERQFIAFLATIEGADVKADYEYQFLSLQINIAGGESVMTAKAASEFQGFISEGWRSLSIYQRPGYIDQLLAILERPLNDERQPFLDLQLETETLPDGPVVLVAGLRNLAVGTIATDIRVYIGGTGHMQREPVPSLLGGDPQVELRERLDDKRAYKTYLKHVDHVIVEFADRFGNYHKQVGKLQQTTADGNVYHLTAKGLERPTALDPAARLPYPSSLLA